MYVREEGGVVMPSRTMAMFVRVLYVSLPSFYNIILLLSVVNVQAQVTAVISPDEDYNAALDPNSNIVFNCTGNRDTIRWTVDNTAAGDPSIVSRGVTATSEVGIGGGMFLSTSSIPASYENNNTAIQCTVADLSSVPVVSNTSKLIFLNIQGLLGPPPNLTLSETDEQLSRLLTWDAPKTLDITNVNPDIEYYQVCYNLSTELTCTNVNSVGERKFKFSNVRVPLLFTVIAFNVVGEGNESSIVHQTSNCDNVGVSSNINDVQSQISLTQSGPEAVIFFNQSRESPRMCFCVYEVRTNTTEHGPLIPVVDSFSSVSVQLSLNIDFGLMENELYAANIITTNNNGMEITVGTVQFSTYDVQSVNIAAIPGGLKLSCTFVSGSQAQSCLLTFCSVENNNIIFDSCVSRVINRNNSCSTFTKQVTGFLPGTQYTIFRVDEVERDGSLTTVRVPHTLGQHAIVAEDPTIPSNASSSSTPNPLPTGDVSNTNNNAGAIAGGCIGVVLVMMFVIAIVVVIVCKWYVSKQTRQETVMYDEPGSIVNTIPQTGLEMEQCPAYGVFNKR